MKKNLIERTAKAPAVWDMIVYAGEPGDPQDNPTLSFAPTNDPVLLFRSPAYAVSFAKRVSGR